MIWHHEKLSPFTATRAADKEDDDDEISQQSHNNRLRMSNFIFNNVISSRFMVMLVGRGERSFEVYADFLVELIKENFITMEIVNELSVGLYKHEWNKVCIVCVFAFGRHSRVSWWDISNTPPTPIVAF